MQRVCAQPFFGRKGSARRLGRTLDRSKPEGGL